MASSFEPDLEEWRRTARLSLEENQPRLYQKLKEDENQLEQIVEERVNLAKGMFDRMITEGSDKPWAYQVATEMVPFPADEEMDEDVMDKQQEVMADFENYLLDSNRI